MDVTAKAIYERLVLVSGWQIGDKIYFIALGAHTATAHPAVISPFTFLAQNFPGVGP